MPKKSTPALESPAASIVFPDYIIRIQRLLAETRQHEAAIKVNAESLGELLGDFNRRILAADPTSQSALNVLAGPAQTVAILERRAGLLAEELAAVKTQLGHSTAQSQSQLRVAANKYDELMHAREVDEKSESLSSDQRRDLQQRSKSWGRPTRDWAFRLNFTASDAPEVMRLAELVFSELPAVQETEA